MIIPGNLKTTLKKNFHTVCETDMGCNREEHPVGFSCQRCGKCCREIGIPWSELDPKLAAEHLKMDFFDFLSSHGFMFSEYSGEIEHTEFNAAPCPFLKYDKENAMCKIYPVRPWSCKGYPGPGILCRAGRQRS